MALLPRFLTRSVDRLALDGSLQSTPLRAASLGAPWLLLDRERCRFEPFAAPPSLKGGALVAAARLHAETRAPYEAPGFLLTRRGGDFGVWWWDAAWVEEMLARHEVGEVRVLPETLLQPEGQGWRVIRGASGYEAQLWSEGFLLASSWRRRPYDAAAWSAFARVQHRGVVDTAPETPPAPISPPLTLASSYRRRLLATRRAADWAPLALTAGAGALVCAATLWTGQGVRLMREHDGLAQRITALRAVAQASLRPRLNAESARLAQLARLTTGPDPLTLVLHAQAILAPFHLKVSGFTATHDEVDVVVAAEAVAGVDLISEELADSPWFADIHPTLDRQKHQLTFRMAVRPRSRLTTPG